MSNFDRFINESDTASSSASKEMLHDLISDWQIVSDMCMSDLALWIRNKSGEYIALAHCRPSTSRTLFNKDFVGNQLLDSLKNMVDDAWENKKITSQDLCDMGVDHDCIRYQAIPMVKSSGEVYAIVTRHTDMKLVYAPSMLNEVYRACADDLIAMIPLGLFPDISIPKGSKRGSPRVPDGLIRLDAAGQVSYISPNGLSAFRRLGVVEDLEGENLRDVVYDLLKDRKDLDGSLPAVLSGRMPWRTEIELSSVTVSLRAIPLRDVEKEFIGAVLLCRDVSEIRGREKELISKDATIREINHRVKNNLQTVSALLRLQSRRASNAEVKEALNQAMTRVSAIALVHENLSQSLQQNVNFDQIVDKSFLLAAEVATSGSVVKAQRLGSFGYIPGHYATPLALVINELVTNAVEHGLGGKPGTITLIVDREMFSEVNKSDKLQIRVCDNGVGIDYNNNQESLGMNIVKTLVSTDLGGSIEWFSRLGGGTEVVFNITLST